VPEGNLRGAFDVFQLAFVLPHPLQCQDDKNFRNSIMTFHHPSYHHNPFSCPVINSCLNYFILRFLHIRLFSHCYLPSSSEASPVWAPLRSHIHPHSLFPIPFSPSHSPRFTSRSYLYQITIIMLLLTCSNFIRFDGCLFSRSR